MMVRAHLRAAGCRRRPWRAWVAAVGVAIALPTLAAQPADSLEQRLEGIFEQGAFEPERFGPARWLDDGDAYTTLDPSGSTPGARDIVRYDTASGAREVPVDASRLVPDGSSEPLEIADYAWSADRRRLLLFTNTARVWRRNTRGDYWVLDVGAGGGMRKLGGDAPASSLMFAKFSPDGSRVAYVRANDLYVEMIESGAIVALTETGSETVINGTSDWVYEEELGVRDGFRWSPDGRRIAFWNFDTTGIESFALINDTDSLYPTITEIPYPKAGTTNSAVRIGVVPAKGGAARWMEVPGDSRNSYIARMAWADSSTLVLQRLNRLQNRNDVLLADAATGTVCRVYRDESDTWVEVGDDPTWLDAGRDFLWLSERDGWRHAYRIARDGSRTTRITNFDADVIRIVGTAERSGWLYFTASPVTATEQHLFRAALDGTGRPERVTSADLPGTHDFPELFKAGVAVAPVPDQRLYNTIYQERYMGLPQDNPDGYRLGSPINFAEGLRGHLLLIHGSGDDNVHYQGTERLVNRLVELRKPFDLMVYPNRTHAIREGAGTTLHLHKLMARYLTELRW